MGRSKIPKQQKHTTMKRLEAEAQATDDVIMIATTQIETRETEVTKFREALELAVVMIKQLEQAAPGNELPGDYRMDGLGRLEEVLKG